MSEPVLVRGGVPGWSIALRILAAIAALAGVGVLLWGDPTLGVVLCVTGGGTWMLLEVVAVSQRAQRTWITDTPDGFVVTDRQAEWTCADDQVIAVAYEQKKIFANGVATYIERKCRLWIADEDQPIELVNRFKNEQADPLDGLLQRLMQRVQRRLHSMLAEGGQVEGDGWWLDREALHATVDRAEVVVPVAELTDCAVFDNQMCLWRVGEDELFARFPAGSRNACVLPLILAEPLERAAQVKNDDGAGLGRILFERRAKRGVRVLLGLVAFVLCVISLGLCFAPGVGMVIGCLVGLSGIGLAYLSWVLKFSVLRCHLRGVTKASLRGERQLKYADVQSFTYSATKQYHHGAYAGTHISLKFEPLPEARVKPLTYNRMVHGEDASLEELRDLISRAIASRMLDRVTEGREVPWTSNLTFKKDGLEYRRGGLLGRKTAELLRFDEYQGFQLDDGTFSLFRKGDKKPVMTESASAANFFPGFYVLQMLLHADRSLAPIENAAVETVDELEEVE